MIATSKDETKLARERVLERLTNDELDRIAGERAASVAEQIARAEQRGREERAEDAANARVTAQAKLDAIVSEASEHAAKLASLLACDLSTIALELQMAELAERDARVEAHLPVEPTTRESVYDRTIAIVGSAYRFARPDASLNAVLGTIDSLRHAVLWSPIPQITNNENEAEVTK